MAHLIQRHSNVLFVIVHYMMFQLLLCSKTSSTPIQVTRKGSSVLVVRFNVSLHVRLKDHSFALDAFNFLPLLLHYWLSYFPIFNCVHCSFDWIRMVFKTVCFIIIIGIRFMVITCLVQHLGEIGKANSFCVQSHCEPFNL